MCFNIYNLVKLVYLAGIKEMVTLNKFIDLIVLKTSIYIDTEMKTEKRSALYQKNDYYYWCLYNIKKGTESFLKENRADQIDKNNYIGYMNENVFEIKHEETENEKKEREEIENIKKKNDEINKKIKKINDEIIFIENKNTKTFNSIEDRFVFMEEFERNGYKAYMKTDEDKNKLKLLKEKKKKLKDKLQKIEVKKQVDINFITDAFIKKFHDIFCKYVEITQTKVNGIDSLFINKNRIVEMKILQKTQNNKKFDKNELDEIKKNSPYI